MSKISDKIISLTNPCAADLGLSIWDAEYIKEAGQWYLRIYIDKPGGVSIDDCEAFSRAADKIIDEADPIAESYIFEVSSAGLERELKRESDFAQFIGSPVEIKLYSPIDGEKSFYGELSRYNNGDVTIITPSGEKIFSKAAIALVRLQLV